MSRKTYEMSFEINGKMGSMGAFSAASSRMQMLKLDAQKLNAQYKQGTITAQQYIAQHSRLETQLERNRRAQQQYNQVLQKQHEMSKSIASAASGSVRNVLSVGAMAGGAAAIGAGFVLGSSINKAIEYEAQLSSIQVQGKLTNEELTKMDDLALKMGAATKYSALQAAQGIEELLKAGLSPATIQAGGLEAALNLATAGGLELTEAAEVMADALNGFKKDGMTAAQVSNILAGAANASSTDVHKLKESLSAVGPVADGIGASFLGVNATLAAFSNNMLKGSDAGTSLKTFLSNVQPQTKEARALFAKFGLTAADGSKNIFFANGKLKDMADVAEVLKDKFGKLNEQQRTDTLFKIFGSDAVRAANILAKEGADGIKEMYKQMGDVTALEVAKKKMDNAAGSIEQMKGAFETLQIRALRPTLPLIKKLADEAGTTIEKLTPAITKGVQNAVDSAKGYLKTHFIDNQEFRDLPYKAKVKYAFDSFKATFDAWYQAGGNTQIQGAVSSLTGYVSDALEGSKEQLAGIGIKLGQSIGSGMLTGLKDFASANPELAAILAFVGTPGPLPAKVAAALAVGGSGEILKGVDAVEKNRNAMDAASASNQQKLEDTSKPFITGETTLQGDNRSFIDKNKDAVLNYFYSKGWVTPHAVGGIFNKPHIGMLGEAGPEAYIPLNGSSRSKSLWQTAGQAIGMDQGGGGADVTIHAPFAPVINGGSAAEILPLLQNQQKDYLEQLQAVLHQQKRVSYDG